jgi:hypothetical protein
MRYITLIRNKMYQRPRLGCVCAGSAMCLLPGLIFAVANRASFVATTCPFIEEAAREVCCGG